MADNGQSNDTALPETPSQDRAKEQEKDSSWPKPGEEGYVTPDGTPQSVAQLAANKQAAADRARAGSIVHGAPLATPGPDPEGETAKAAARAAKHGPEGTDPAVGRPDGSEARTTREAAPRERRS